MDSILAAQQLAGRKRRPAALRLCFIAVVVVALASSCATQPPPRPGAPAGAPAEFPAEYYRQAFARGQAVYRIDPERSLLVIEVHRGGSLARLGHDHVLASHDLCGLIAPQAGRADLYFSLDRLVVDEPELRAQAKLEGHPSEEDIEGTRHNMLNGLQAEQYPYALVSVSRIDTSGSETRLKLAITVHGTTRIREVAAVVEIRSETIYLSGSLSLDQTQFGIKPLSILGGALQVEDRVDLRFRIWAPRLLSASDA
ncbi:MAG TPA: YceI family protein [Casimicrobiaceae bacterium]|nr:YceI family protein [Casimicrobiaceae bacterium]